MTLARFARGAFSCLGLILAGVLVFDVAAYFVFPDLVRRVEPKYASEVGAEILRAAQVEPYYTASETRGFDIAPGARSLDWHPPDIDAYPIWGNSLGCFDEEPLRDVAPDIYLAGDSFTWGFAPYEAKFGTILERETGLMVYSCGVWHSGQRHQFDKFLEIADSYPGWPTLVIVNVYDNDYINDLAFPHTTVINGVLVETKYVTEENGELVVHPATDYKRIVTSLDVRYLLKTYSATANIVNVAIRDVIAGSALGYRWVGAMQDEAHYPIRTDAAAPNREAIRRWLAHATTNDYQIRFALISDSGDFDDDVYREFKEFLAENGAIAWDFAPYVLARGMDPATLYWPVDIHFNEQGNAVYADFLLEKLKEEIRTGALSLDAW